MAATGGMEDRREKTEAEEKEPGRAGEEGRTDGWTDGGKQGEAGVVGEMDPSLPVRRAEQTLFDQLTAMQLKDRLQSADLRVSVNNLTGGVDEI